MPRDFGGTAGAAAAGEEGGEHLRSAVLRRRKRARGRAKGLTTARRGSPYRQFVHTIEGIGRLRFAMTVRGGAEHGVDRDYRIEDEDAAEEWARSFKRRIERAAQAGEVVDVGQRTVPPRTINAAFVRYLLQHGRFRKTGKHIKTVLERWTIALGADTPLTEISIADIAAYVSRRRDELVRTGGTKASPGRLAKPSPMTINYEISILKAALMYAREMCRAQIAMPSREEWRRVKLPRGPKRKVYPDDAQEASLTGAMREEFRPVARFAVLSGLRKANSLIKWAQVRWDSLEIQVYVKHPDAAESKLHIVPIDDEIRDILLAERGKHPVHVFTYVARIKRNPKTREAYVVGERRPMTVAALDAQWRIARKACGLKGRFRWHDWRRKAATETLEATGDITKVRDLLGHATVAQSEEYCGVRSNGVREAQRQRAAWKVAQRKRQAAMTQSADTILDSAT